MNEYQKLERLIFICTVAIIMIIAISNIFWFNTIRDDVKQLERKVRCF
jgi:preprotein translocase subunit YajC